MSSLSFSACGGYMATGGRDQVVCVWDLASLKAVQTVLALVSTANTAHDFVGNVKWVWGTHFMWTKTFAGYTFVIARLKF